MTKKIGSTLCTILIFLLWILAFSGGGTTQVSGTSNDITRFPIGANIPGGIPSGTTSYTITPKASGGNTIGSVFTINIDDRCSKYNSVDLL
jgi:hypothetical protein